MEHAFFCGKTGGMRYVIEGRPVPLARARHGNRRCWDAQKQLKLGIGLSLRNQHGTLPLFSGPLAIDIVFYFRLPASMSAVRKAAAVGRPHVSRPDLDNLIKFVLDVATDILFADDSIIATINAAKCFGEQEATYFKIRPL